LDNKVVVTIDARCNNENSFTPIITRVYVPLGQISLRRYCLATRSVLYQLATQQLVWWRQHLISKLVYTNYFEKCKSCGKSQD